ncbi:MAG TPA: squalene synthase HpnC [Caulobacteraceae bacterium]|jgi:squalene synthase HpnC|nr:squalene synthase HpnC [Caulobacteraceae bacterium]
MSAADLASGKGRADENFPVASHLIAPPYRPPIMAFYRVARLADDVADHATATPEQKLARLADIEASLTGKSAAVPEAVALAEALAERHLGWEHMLDLLEAFRRDVTKLRYESWDELMDYCRYSAAPVGRFVLDVHGEDRSTWPVSDALCAALQVINHLQDCAKDYHEIDRVYLPKETLDACGASIEMLAEDAGNQAMTAAIRILADNTTQLLRASRPFAGQIRDLRLSLEVGAIQRLAESLTQRLRERDPLSEETHHSRLEAVAVGLLGVGRTLQERIQARQGRAAGS